MNWSHAFLHHSSNHPVVTIYLHIYLPFRLRAPWGSGTMSYHCALHPISPHSSKNHSSSAAFLPPLQVVTMVFPSLGKLRALTQVIVIVGSKHDWLTANMVPVRVKKNAHRFRIWKQALLDEASNSGQSSTAGSRYHSFTTGLQDANLFSIFNLKSLSVVKRAPARCMWQWQTLLESTGVYVNGTWNPTR